MARFTQFRTGTGDLHLDPLGGTFALAFGSFVLDFDQLTFPEIRERTFLVRQAKPAPVQPDLGAIRDFYTPGS
ncbi:MAG: hypothetical protein V3R42_03380 [candidate division NC10 bacterium]